MESILTKTKFWRVSNAIHYDSSSYQFHNQLTRTSSDAFCFHWFNELFMLAVSIFPVDGNRICSDPMHFVGCCNSNFVMASVNCVCSRFLSCCWCVSHAFVYTVNFNANRQKYSPKMWLRRGHDRFVCCKYLPTDTFCWIIVDRFVRLPVQ